MSSVNIQYQYQHQPISKDYDLMVIACDPRNLKSVCNFSDQELEIFSGIENFTFHTTLIKIPVTKPQEHGVVFSPYALDKMVGNVYGFRNESAKKFGLNISNTMDENLITIYQLQGAVDKPYTKDEFLELLRRELPTLDWWTFGTDYTIMDSVTTPYFDHFSDQELIKHTPWNLFNLQGIYNTIYVHAFTCFESALHCWGYEDMILDQFSDKLPTDTSAHIAIIGAGVSGLLFALKLKRLGYSNINILESTDRYGGKTHTIKMEGPYPYGSKEPTYCELGTCYLSPAYQPMTADLAQYLIGNDQIPFGDKVQRGIVTKGQLPPSFNPPPIMDNGIYVLRKAEAELGKKPGTFDDLETQVILLSELAKYIIIHKEVFGGNFPTTVKPPLHFLNEHSSQTYSSFLNYHNLKGMVGILQYGYEVQGYGILEKIPAYYGLVWITPPIIETMIINAFIELADKFGISVEDVLKTIIQHIPDGAIKSILEDIVSKIDKDLPKQRPVVTAWSKGWGNLWTEIVQKEKLNILFKTEINAIRRGN